MNKNLLLYLALGLTSFYPSYSVSGEITRLNKTSLQSMIERHEGKRNTSYPDRGGRSVGVGHYISGYNDPEIKAVGADPKLVYLGKQKLSDKQVYQLLEKDISQAKEIAKKYVGTKFNQLPEEIQNVVTDLAFNLGEEGITEFIKFRISLLYKDYPGAAKELENSRYYKQVGNRAKELCNILRNYQEKSKK